MLTAVLNFKAQLMLAYYILNQNCSSHEICFQLKHCLLIVISDDCFESWDKIIVASVIVVFSHKTIFPFIFKVLNYKKTAIALHAQVKIFGTNEAACLPANASKRSFFFNIM